MLPPDAEQSLMADVGNWQYPNNTCSGACIIPLITHRK